MEERIINIGTRLKQRRKEMHIKQTEMAKELGVSQTYLSNIEGGKANCSITLLVDICNYLNVTPDYLMLGNMRGRTKLSAPVFFIKNILTLRTNVL